MSSESATTCESGSLEWSGVRLRYKFKWIIPVEKFQLPEKKVDNPVLAQSRWVKIKGLFDLSFCLELRFENVKTNYSSFENYEIIVKGACDPIRMPIELYYAFVILDGKAYVLKRPASEDYLKDKLSVGTIKWYKRIKNSEIQSIAVHCAVYINGDVHVVTKEDGDGILENIVLQERRISPQVEAFVFGGEIPKFTIRNAEQWIKEADEFGAVELKAIYQEYLKSELTKETAMEIIDIAFACGMVDLYKRCKDEIRSSYVDRI